MGPGNTAVGRFCFESHTDLVQFPLPGKAADAALNAIIVPTIRPRRLSAAIRVAQEVGCLLVVLCSTAKQRRRAAERAARLPPENVLVLNVLDSAEHGNPPFHTPRYPELESDSPSHVDIARKRNVGLLLARLSGWRRVLFLDDDIRGLNADVLATALGLASDFAAVGFEIGTYPDNSVVCHAHRLANGKQGVFPGGSALLVNTERVDSFFPPIYNEDWLFLFDVVRERSIAVAGTLSQLVYNPFASARRAVSEEFGDLIAEGLFWLIHEGEDAKSATSAYWRDAIERRSWFIDDIATRLLAETGNTREIDDALMSLVAAKRRLSAITPSACVSFVRTWLADLDKWRETLSGLPLLGSPHEAVRHLELAALDRPGAVDQALSVGGAAVEAAGQVGGGLADAPGQDGPGVLGAGLAAEGHGDRRRRAAAVVEAAGGDAGEAVGDVTVFDRPAAVDVLAEKLTQFGE
jgi:hypothetical protein